MLLSRIFVTFYKIIITFERKIIFTCNLVFLCQIISSTMTENSKQKLTFFAELLRFRYMDYFLFAHSV